MTSNGGREYEPDQLSAREYLDSIHPVAAEERIAYDTGPSQWFDVYWPTGPGPFPVVVLVHGGCWSTVASAESVSPNAAELADSGVAVCNLEYRRVGEPGGGFPGTYLDLAKAIDSLRSASITSRLDLARVVVVGHSAGAHLALWLASRSRLPEWSPLYSRDPLPISSVVAIAGPGDLRSHIGLLGITCAGMSTADQVIGPTSELRRNPFLDTSPFELLPLGVRTVSITGVYDDNWPPYVSARWRRAARAAGDDAQELVLPDAGHFEVVDIRSNAWRTVRDTILEEVRRA